MSDKAIFACAVTLNLDVQWTHDKHQVHPAGCASKDLRLGQTVKSVIRMCSNVNHTAHVLEGSQKWV